MHLLFPANAKLNNYLPAVTSKELAFVELNCFEPRLGRLIASKAPTLFQDLELDAEDKVLRFCYYTLTGLQYSNLYAITTKAIYWFDFAAEEFDPTPIYTYGYSRLDYPQVLPWYDCLYVVRPGHPSVRLEAKVVTEIPTMPFGRYGIVLASHIFLGNVGNITNQFFTRVQWSDLDDPESWSLLPNSSEADFFNLEAGETEITGVSAQRGNGIIYTRDTIWQATYVGFASGNFSFQPLFQGLGNNFHYSLVRVKEVDYFIGPDGFYRLNGYQPENLGTEVWNRFISEVKISTDAAVPGFLDSRRDQIFWIYTKTDDTKACIVYNYKENSWCFRADYGIVSFFDAPRAVLKGYTVINDISTLIADDDHLIDDPEDNFPLTISQFVGLETGTRPVAVFDNSYEDLESGSTTAVAETFDFFLDSLESVKEFHRITVEHRGSGNPLTSLALEVGTRNNQRANLTWSSAISQVNIDGSLSFYFKKDGIGKYVRFRFTATNDSTNNLSELWLISLTESTPPDADSSR